jgi:hypothetical protein
MRALPPVKAKSMARPLEKETWTRGRKKDEAKKNVRVEDIPSG